MAGFFHDHSGIRVMESGLGNRDIRQTLYPEQQQKFRPEIITRRLSSSSNTSSSNKGPLHYEEYLFTKEPARHGQKEIWARSRKTAIPRDQSDLQDRINKQIKKEGPARKQLNAPEMAGNKQIQVKQLLKNRMKGDDPNFEYVLASIMLESRTKSKNTETTAMHVIIKRQVCSDIRFNPAMATAPPQIITSEVVDLIAQGNYQGQVPGAAKAPPQAHMGQGAFHNPGPMNAPWGHGGQPRPEIIDHRFQPQQGGHPQGGQQHPSQQHPGGHPPPPSMHPVFQEQQGGRHDFENQGNKGKDQKGKQPQIIQMDSQKPPKKQPDFSDDTSSSGHGPELFDIDDFEDRFGFDDKIKKPKDKKKNLDMDDFEFVDFVDKGGEKAKDKKKGNFMNLPKHKKKKHQSPISSSDSESNEEWSDRSDHSAPTTISRESGPRTPTSRGQSYKKETPYFDSNKKDKHQFKDDKKNKGYYKEDNHHKSSHGDRDDREPPNAVYREHLREDRRKEARRRDPSPGSMPRSGGHHYTEDEVIIEPANSRSRRDRGPPRYQEGAYSERSRHHRDPSHDGDVYPNDHLRGLGLGRNPTVHRPRIANSAYSSTRYESEEEDMQRHQTRLREEAKSKQRIREEVQQQVREELFRQEEEARIQKEVREELAFKAEERRMQEQDRRDRIAREMMAREPVYDPLPPRRREARGYYNDRF